MGLSGRFFGPRDMKLIASLNAELMGDILQTEVLIFKRCPQETDTNIYGEADPSTGNVFFPGVAITSIIDRADLNTEYDDFGPTRKQDVIFKFREDMLKLVNVYPEVGDIIQFNNRYHEINNTVQEQFLGGIPEKSFSIICNTIYSRLSKLSLVERQT